MLTNTGLNKFLQQLKAGLVDGAYGTADTTPTEADTTLTTQTGTASLEDESVTNQTYTTKATVLTTEANGQTLQEFGLLFDDNTLFDHNIHPDLDKTNSDEVIYFNKVIVERGD